MLWSCLKPKRLRYISEVCSPSALSILTLWIQYAITLTVFSRFYLGFNLLEGKGLICHESGLAQLFMSCLVLTASTSALLPLSRLGIPLHCLALSLPSQKCLHYIIGYMVAVDETQVLRYARISCCFQLQLIQSLVYKQKNVRKTNECYGNNVKNVITSWGSSKQQVHIYILFHCDNYIAQYFGWLQC